MGNKKELSLQMLQASGMEQGLLREILEGATEFTALCWIQEGRNLFPLRFPGIIGFLSKIIIPISL